jgi:hypothetical protein
VGGYHCSRAFVHRPLEYSCPLRTSDDDGDGVGAGAGAVYVTVTLSVA